MELSIIYKYSLKKIISCEIFSTSFVNKLNEGFNRYALCNRRIPIKPLKIEIINI